MGGKEKAGEVLDYLFNTKQETTGKLADVTGLIGQYAHGNEPSHHVAYIYAYLDRPWETERLVRQICNDFYKNRPDGLIGNDDCGQMSAWYIFSAMGFYPMNPASGEFVLGAPQVKSASINVGNGKRFTVEAKELSEENLHVERVELNGKPYNEKRSVTDIMEGASLVFYIQTKRSGNQEQTSRSQSSSGVSNSMVMCCTSSWCNRFRSPPSAGATDSWTAVRVTTKRHHVVLSVYRPDVQVVDSAHLFQ